MKTSKEFFERLQSDEAFATEVGEKVKTKIDAGEQDYKAVWIPVAAEFDYELTGEELDELYEKNTAELTDEELGKVSGGITPIFVVTSILVTSMSGLISLSVTLNTTEFGDGDDHGEYNDNPVVF